MTVRLLLAGWCARPTLAGRGEGGNHFLIRSGERSLVQQLHHDDEAGKGQSGRSREEPGLH